MELFENEKINISNIVAVEKFTNSKEMIEKLPVYHLNTEIHYYELIFFLYGDCITQFGDVIIHDCRDSLRYLPVGKTNIYKATRKAEDSCIGIYFETPDTMPETAIGFLDKHCLRDLFAKIYTLWSQKIPGYYTKSMSVLYNIISTIKFSKKSYISATHKNALNSALDYISQNYTDKNFNYQSLCQSSGFSYSYFKELFVTEFKMPPVKYITNIRIQHAKDLIVSRHYSITEVAELCGFENIYYFSSVFKKYVGVPPSKYSKTT